MSAPVDVLAVLDDLIADMGDTPGTTGHQVAHVRGAVAELIEAARIVATHQDASISAEWDRLDAALANCGGAS